MTAEEWTRCTKATRCPICGRDKYCMIADNANVVLCTKTFDAPPGWYKIKDAPEGEGGIYRKGEPKQRGPSWNERAREMKLALSTAKLNEFAAVLGLPADSFKALDIGWYDDDKKQRAYSFPERNGSGTTVGVNLQTLGRDKWMVPKSHHGLFIPNNLIHLPDPVLIVEGASDTAACHAVKVAAVGRPSNRGGVEHLLKLLKDRDVIVVGEHDPKDDGRWPGRDGAVAVAGKLAQGWGRPVKWAMTPEKAKDVRVWVRDRLGREKPEAIGVQLVARLREMSTTVEATIGQENRALVANVIETFDAGRMKRFAIPLPLIAAQVHRATDTWPRRVNGLLFVADTEPPPVGEVPSASSWRTLTKTEQFFGWLHENCVVRWSERSQAEDRFSGEPVTPPTKGEFHASMMATAKPNYQSVELLPHEPAFEDSYYLPMELPKSDGSALTEFIEHLNPETPLDRDLLTAALLTMGWGGPCGARPAFVLTSRHGRGVGKTKTAELLAQVFGGAITIGEHEDWDRVRTRLLSDASLHCRVVLIDNVRGQMARSGLESAVTAKTIDGHRMFLGQYSRPNTLTWLLTANTPSLSADLTARSVVCQIGPQQHASDFESWARHFMEHRRVELIADVLRRLAAGPVCAVPMELRDRWGSWIDGVLRTFPNATELLEYIQTGRPSVDQDLHDAEEVASVIHSMIRAMHLDPELNRVSILKKELWIWLIDAGVITKQRSLKATSMWIDSLRGMEPLMQLSEDPSHTNGRRWMWCGDESAGTDTFMHDPRTHGLTGEGQHPGNYRPLPKTQDEWEEQRQQDDQDNEGLIDNIPF